MEGGPVWEERQPLGKMTEYFQGKFDESKAQNDKMIAEHGFEATLMTEATVPQWREMLDKMIEGMFEMDELFEKMIQNMEEYVKIQIVDMPIEDG